MLKNLVPFPVPILGNSQPPVTPTTGYVMLPLASVGMGTHVNISAHMYTLKKKRGAGLDGTYLLCQLLRRLRRKDHRAHAPENIVGNVRRLHIKNSNNDNKTKYKNTSHLLV